ESVKDIATSRAEAQALKIQKLRESVKGIATTTTSRAEVIKQAKALKIQVTVSLDKRAM
ncbi:5459_t:CDS:2, partial [Paraglomus occultum]